MKTVSVSLCFAESAATLSVQMKAFKMNCGQREMYIYIYFFFLLLGESLLPILFRLRELK